MRKYSIDIRSETFEVKASSLAAAVSRAVKQAKAQKLFKDRVGDWIRIDVDRVE